MSAALVTGANGFIGSALCRRLSADGYDVVSAGRQQRHQFAGSQWRCFDLAEEDWPERLLDGISHVFHLGAYTHTDAGDPRLIERVNHIGASRLADLAVASGVRSFVFVSSILAAKPESGAYAGAKYRAEKALLQHSYSAMRVVMLRPALVYGPGALGNLELIMRAVAGGWFPPPPPNVGHRPMISIDDLVEAIMFAGFKECVETAPITLCDGQHYSLRRLVQLLCEGFGRRMPQWYLPRILWLSAGLAGDLVSNIPGAPSLPGRTEVRRMFNDVAMPDPGPLLPNWQPKLRLDDCVGAMCSAWQDARH